MDEPTLQVATLNSLIGGNQQRIFELKICLWHGPTVPMFTDLPPDAQQVLREWIGRGENHVATRVGTTWLTSLPCPDCGSQTVIGYLFTNELGEHVHTKYLCTFWKGNPPGVHTESVTRPCGWTGWSVPGWDEEK